MNELQLSLIAAGVAILLVVVAYNAWQGSKAKRRMPRRMPLEEVGVDATASPSVDDDRPFIEPMPLRMPSQDERREPTLGAAHAVHEAAEASIGPSHLQADGLDGATDHAGHGASGGLPQAAVDADEGGHVPDVVNGAVAHEAEAHLQPDASDAEGADNVAPMAKIADADADRAVDDAVNASPVSEDMAKTAEGADRTSPSQVAHNGVLPSAAKRAANVHGPLPIVDERIDCVVSLPLAMPLSAERILPLTQRMRRAGSKAIHIEGRADDSAPWELVRNGGRYGELRMAVQLANRAGALNEVEFSEFANAVQTLADAVDALPEYPDMVETVARARELDSFAAQCDAQLSVNVLSDGAPWSANYVQAVATQDGMLLSRDGMRFVKLDSRQSSIFMLQFGDTNFLRDDLTYKGGDLITLLLDVPVADEDLLPFRLMCDYAKSIAQRIGGRVVDDQRRTLSDAALQNVDHQLLMLYERLEARGLPAGSPVTRRLFSQ